MNTADQGLHSAPSSQQLSQAPWTSRSSIPERWRLRLTQQCCGTSPPKGGKVQLKLVAGEAIVMFLRPSLPAGCRRARLHWRALTWPQTPRTAQSPAGPLCPRSSRCPCCSQSPAGAAQPRCVGPTLVPADAHVAHDRPCICSCACIEDSVVASQIAPCPGSSRPSLWIVKPCMSTAQGSCCHEIALHADTPAPCLMLQTPIQAVRCRCR